MAAPTILEVNKLGCVRGDRRLFSGLDLSLPGGTYLQVTGPNGAPLFGRNRDYQWFIREGIFVRSPLRADGVAIDEDDRIEEEDDWIRRERRRNREEPRFVSAAYFLRFRFDPGQYALAGREQLDGRDVLRVEYYPTKLFLEGRLRPNRGRRPGSTSAPRRPARRSRSTPPASSRRRTCAPPGSG